ncbi:MAG: hypothetical protein ACC656_06740, partial [Candidatus Heimdallarchaeota archaeon]
NLSIENLYALVIRRDFQTLVFTSFILDLNDYSTIFMSWSSNAVKVRVDGEEMIFFENSNNLLPISKMYYYVGAQSGGWPDRNNEMEINNVILSGPTSGSDMPILVNPSNGYLFVEGDTDMTLSWMVDDDDPGNYTLWLAGTFVEVGTWESNQVITYTIDNFLVGLYEMIIQVWDRTGNSIIQAIFVKIIKSTYFTNNKYREDFDGPTLDADWNFHEVQGSTFEFQDGKLNFEGGGVAVIEHTKPISVNSSFLINIAMNEPVTHGGSGFGLSNYDYTSTSFTQGDIVFSPFIRDDASDTIFITNSDDGSYYKMIIKANNILSEYDFYLEDPQIQDFLLLRNLNGIELYVSNKLVRSFDAASYNLPQKDLFFSAYATSWSKPGFNQINYYQIQNDTSTIIPNDVSLEMPLENTFSFTIPDENIIDIIDNTGEVNITKSTELFTSNQTLSEELDLNLLPILIGGLVILLIIASIIMIDQRLNPRLSGQNKEFEDSLVDELEGFNTDGRLNITPFSGLCANCGTLSKVEDTLCRSCGVSFK